LNIMPWVMVAVVISEDHGAGEKDDRQDENDPATITTHAAAA